MTEIKKHILKNRFLFNDLNEKKKQIIKSQKSSSLNNLTVIKRKFKLDSKKNLNIIEFIKQKNKFVIESSFDVNGTREFLASKEVAMRAIRLNDEITEEKKDNIVKKNSLTDKNLHKINISSYNENENVKKEEKNDNNRTISPRKSRKSAKLRIRLGEEIKHKKTKKSKKSKKNEKKTVKFKSSKIIGKESKVNISNSSIKNNIGNNIIFEKADSESVSNIYKFIIDNANETEENFNKKLQIEIKKVEDMKQNKDKDKDQNKSLKRKSISRKDLKYKRAKRLNSLILPKNRKTQSAFMFSEFNKNLMKDDISISSIGENSKIPNDDEPNKKKGRRAYGSIQINNMKVKEKIQKQMKDQKISNIVLGKEEINSDKDSIISILSDLM